MDTKNVNFEEMVNNPGLYVADSFKEGVCLKINENGELYLLTYKSKNDFCPTNDLFHFYKGLLNKSYRKVLNTSSLFKN